MTLDEHARHKMTIILSKLKFTEFIRSSSRNRWEEKAMRKFNWRLSVSQRQDEEATLPNSQI